MIFVLDPSYINNTSYLKIVHAVDAHLEELSKSNGNKVTFFVELCLMASEQDKRRLREESAVNKTVASRRFSHVSSPSPSVASSSCILNVEDF